MISLVNLAVSRFRRSTVLACAVAGGLLLGVCHFPAYAEVDSTMKLEGKPDLAGVTDKDAAETIDADKSQLLLQRFNAENPNARVHELHKVADAYEDSASNPGLRLERVYVGENATLLEIVGLERTGKSVSAVIRRDTFGIRERRGALRKLVAFEGVTELRDRKGGSALIVKPGDTLYALMEPIDDFYPFSVEHMGWGYKTFTYFENVDPRFRERYLKAYGEATTPEKMKDFIVEFAQNDPDKKVPQVFLTLIKRMREQDTFEGYYNAYLLMQDPQDARMASKMARTDEHRAMMENIAVATLADKGRLIDFDFMMDGNRTRDGEGSCWMLCRYNFTASRAVSGTLTVRAKPGPIKLKYGTYTVSISASGVLPRYNQRRSAWLGNFDGQNDDKISRNISVILSPPNYTATVPVNLGTFTVAFFERGSMGGYDAKWANGDGQVTLNFQTMELTK